MSLRKKNAAAIKAVVGLLVLAAALWFLPAMAPLVIFGLVIALLGDGLVAFTISTAAGAGFALAYPRIFSADHYYNAGQGTIGAWDLIISQIDATIMGLLVLNAFFTIMFKNRYFQDYGLPMLRSLGGTAKRKLTCGWVLALVNFSDDLAAGGVLNRLYEADLKSPAVSKPIRDRMLVMILLLANAFPAIIPVSSWGAFYHKIYPGFDWRYSLYIMLPAVLIGFCFFMAVKTRRQHSDERVIPVDFLREKHPKRPDISQCWLGVFLALPLTVTIFLLVYYSCTGRNEFALLYSFGIGLFVQIITLSLLGFHDYRWGKKASPFLGSDDIATAQSSIVKADEALKNVRSKLLNLTLQEDDLPLESDDPLQAARLLDETTLKASMLASSLRKVGDLSIRERFYPALRQPRTLFFRLGAFWKKETDNMLKTGITDMVGSFYRVFLMLLLAAATSACFGITLNGDARRIFWKGECANVGVEVYSPKKIEPQIEEMLDSEGRVINSFKNWEFERLGDIDIKLAILALFFAGFLWLFRYLRVSSAWGIAAIVVPLTQVFIGRSEATPLVSMCFFGMVISFGIWCNSTLPTGDNVEIAQEIQGGDCNEKIDLSSKAIKWPLICCSVSLLIVLLFHKYIEGGGAPGWTVYCVIPLALIGLSVFVSYLKNRKLFSEL